MSEYGILEYGVLYLPHSTKTKTGREISVVRIDEQGVVTKYKSITEAAKESGCKYDSIYKCCLKNRDAHKHKNPNKRNANYKHDGYMWFFYADVELWSEKVNQ